MKFGITFYSKKQNNPYRGGWLYFVKPFWPWHALHPTSEPAHTVTLLLHSSYLLSLPAGRLPVWSPTVRWVSSPRVSTSLSGFFCVPSPKFTGGHCSSYWHSCFPDIPHSPPSYRRAATISNLAPVPNNIQLCFAFKSNATKSGEGGRNKLAAQRLHVGSTTWVLMTLFRAMIENVFTQSNDAKRLNDDSSACLVGKQREEPVTPAGG